LLAYAWASTLFPALQLSLIFLLLLPSTASAQNSCRDLFSAASARQARPLQSAELSKEAAEKIMAVPEFQFIRKAAEERGLRVWLFGGTAASYLHYVKWDLLRRNGVLNLQAERFDYDYTNIFRSTQDLDIVVDATAEKAKEFEGLLKQRFPHFLGSKANKWEVRPLMHTTGKPGEQGYKEALLNDLDFSLQNTDSNSVAMVEITSRSDTNPAEPVVRDLRSWNDPSARSQFLDDTVKNEITYFRSPKHFQTARARLGENPEILSVIRVLVKAFQYELRLSKESEAEIKQVIREFQPREIRNEAALRRIKDTSEKLIKHAVNIEYAVNKLDELGLRKKLIAMGDPNIENSFAWWLSREPLRTRPIGQGSGRTAKELGIETVAHETRSFLAYESITRAHSGEPNILMSRENTVGESAAYGEGFYTKAGRAGAVGSGLTIRFRLNPNAREGKDADFTIHGDFVLIHNKAALEVIPESLEFHLKDLLEIARGEKNLEIEHSDLALLEKLKRKLTATKVSDELLKLYSSESKSDVENLARTVFQIDTTQAALLLSEQARLELVKLAHTRLNRFFDLSKDSHVLVYIRLVGPLLRSLILYDLMSKDSFEQFLKKTIQLRYYHPLTRRAALEELMLSNVIEAQKLVEKLPSSERSEFELVLSKWRDSQDQRKSRFAREYNNQIAGSIKTNVTFDDFKHLSQSPFFDVNFVSAKSQQPLLMIAVSYGRLDIVRFLLSFRRLDVNARAADIEKKTAIHLAAEQGKFDILKALLRHPKADPWIRTMSGINRQIPGNTFLHLGLSQFNLLNRSKRLELLKIAQATPGFDVNARGVDDSTILHIAISTKDLELAKRILEIDGVNPNLVDRFDKSILKTAISGDEPEFLRLLIKSPQLDRSQISFDLLLYVLQQLKNHDQKDRRHEMFQILVNQHEIDINSLSSSGESLLTSAISAYNERAAHAILDRHDFNQVNVIARSQHFNLKATALYGAIKKRMYSVALRLLQRHDTDPNGTYPNGPHPLFAISDLNLEVLEALLKHPKIQLNPVGSNGETPLSMLNNADPEVIERYVTDTRVDQRTPFQARDSNNSFESRHNGMPWYHALSPYLLADLSDRMANNPRFNLNLTDQEGNTLLHRFVDRMSPGSRYSMEENGMAFYRISRIPVDRSIRNKLGLTALELAYAISPSSEITQILIDREIEQTMKPTRLNYPLRKAMELQIRLRLKRAVEPVKEKIIRR